MTARIVLLDPQPEEGSAFAGHLVRHGIAADTLVPSEAVLQRLAAHPPGLVLLHRRIRQEADLGVLRRLRVLCRAPVIVRAMDVDDETDRVLALELGADDYVPTSTSPRELLARIRTVLRRTQVEPAPGPAASGWRLCLRARELYTPDGEARHLTSAEFELMQHLVRQQGVPVQRDALSLAVLRRPYHPEDRALDNLVLRLRRKLGDEGVSARLIKSVRGVGYVFVGFDAVPMPGAIAGALQGAMPGAATSMGGARPVAAQITGTC